MSENPHVRGARIRLCTPTLTKIKTSDSNSAQKFPDWAESLYKSFRTFEVPVLKVEHSTTNNFIPKLYSRLLWFFRRTAALFRQIRTCPQLFRFCSDSGNPGFRQIVRNSMLTGRRWAGRILINLCGNHNVRNCDLVPSDFFDRWRTVLAVAKGFFWYVVKLGKR